MTSLDVKRDEGVDIAKGFGILFVIGGHCNFGLTDLYAYSFHMPLFYFISGFFLFRYHELSHFSSPAFMFRKVKDLLLPYFVYNLIFGILSYLLQYADIKFNAANFFDVVSFTNLFVAPFINGNQYQISCALWFVPSLFLVMCCFCLLRRFTAFMCSSLLLQILFVVLLVGVYYVCANRKTFAENQYEALAARTVIGYCFCMLGLVYYKNIKYFNPFVVLFAAICVYGCISIHYGLFNYSVIFNYYGSGAMKDVSFFLSMAGILIVLSVSNILAKTNKFLHAEDMAWLGKSSFHIMAVHLACFLLLNCIIASTFPSKSFSDITNIYFRYPNITWIYFFFSLTVSCIFVKYLNATKEKFLSLKAHYLQ